MKPARRILLLWTLLAVAGGLSGCGSPLRGGGSSRVEDAVITAKVKTAILLNRHLDSFRINVETRDGVVTLKGLVPGAPQKDLAEEIARSVDGVEKVVSILRIDREGGELPDPRDRTFTQKIRDASITASVKSALLLRKGIRANDISVKTHWGVVTVEGPVRSEEERETVIGVGRDVWDVREVLDRLRIVPETGHGKEEQTSRWVPSDLLISSQVRNALALSRRVDGSGIRVATRNGVVRLSGLVSSRDEEGEAIRIAEGIWGVEKVTSRLEVR